MFCVMKIYFNFKPRDGEIDSGGCGGHMILKPISLKL